MFAGWLHHVEKVASPSVALAGLWTHHVLIGVLAVGWMIIKACHKPVAAGGVLLGKGLGPHMVRMGDALGERYLDPLSDRLSPPKPQSVEGLRADGMPIDQLRLDIAPAHAHVRR